MGTAKKEASRRTREGKQKDGNIKVKGENFYRSASKSSPPFRVQTRWKP